MVDDKKKEKEKKIKARRYNRGTQTTGEEKNQLGQVSDQKHDQVDDQVDVQVDDQKQEGDASIEVDVVNTDGIRVMALVKHDCWFRQHMCVRVSLIVSTFICAIGSFFIVFGLVVWIVTNSGNFVTMF